MSTARLSNLAARLVVGAAVGALLASGCASTSTRDAPAESQASEANPTPFTEPGAERGERDVRDSAVSAVVSPVHLEPVYFETDAAALRPEARHSLERYAQSILDHPEWGVVTVEGHCDERGSDAYNEELGMRRAAAVQKHLVEMGVPVSRLSTRTYGSLKPAVRGHDESAWRQNRRSELRAGGVHASISG